MKKVILAFSGGLDTCFSIPWLKEKGYSVISVVVNTGGFEEKELKEIKERAERLGVIKHYNVDASEEIFDKIIAYLIKLDGLYQGIYPLLCADRYIVAEKCVEIAKKENAKAVAHGCTAAGNDQVRFDISFTTLAPNLKILSPIREFQKNAKSDLREKEIEYLAKRGFELPKKHTKYTVNKNILGVTISGAEIDENKEPDEEAFTLTKSLDQTPHKPSYVKLTFEKGVPVKLNDKKTSGVKIIKELNKLAGKHGCGRFIYTGDCIIGIKGRIAFEAPGLHAILSAHKALEEAILSKEQNQFKSLLGQKWTELVFSGLYYEPLRRDIERFIDSNQEFVCGDLKLKIFRGVVLPVKLASKYLVKEKGTTYAQKASWTPEEAKAFTKLFGLATKICVKRQGKSI